MITVDISYESSSYEEVAPREFIEAIIQKTCSLLHVDNCELSCSFIGDETMSELNQQYRGKDEPTDILSFVQKDGDEFPIFSENIDQSKPLGDMLISLQTMKRNCSEFSVSEGEELTRLMIHGVLHLLGWDHATNEGDEPMLQKQEELVKIVAKELHS